MHYKVHPFKMTIQWFLVYSKGLDNLYHYIIPEYLIIKKEIPVLINNYPALSLLLRL